MDIARVRRRMKLHDLETLAAVVRAGGMHKAADSLHVTQPAVSKSIRQLEDALGLRLFERGRQGTAPTVFGAALARRTAAVFDELQNALRELDHLADPDRGEVRLGSMETLHAGLVGATVGRMLGAHPRMRIVIESGQSAELISHFLLGRHVDFVVARPLSLPLPQGVRGEPLFHDRMKVAVGSGNPLARRRRIALDELVDARWVLSRNEIMPGTPLRAAFEQRGLPFPSRVVTSGSLHLRASLLADGEHLTLVPHSLLPFQEFRETYRVLPIELPSWPAPTMILTLAGRALGPAAMLFLDRLRAMARPLAVDAPRLPHRRRSASQMD